MVRAISRGRRTAALVVAALAGLGIWFAFARIGAKHTPTGVFTSLPLTWNEAASVGAILQSDESPHWARETIAGGGRLVPLDVLDARSLAALRQLVIAQPRPLTPAENVALDAWVRQGGRVLLIADPMLTEPSIFPLGDPRRPQPVVLLSPILTHWGLELRFADAQPLGPRVATALGGPVVVDLAGQFVATAGGSCRTEDGGLVARCTIGNGGVVAFADGAVLARDAAGPTQSRALSRLLAAAFRPE